MLIFFKKSIDIGVQKYYDRTCNLSQRRKKMLKGESKKMSNFFKKSVDIKFSK